MKTKTLYFGIVVALVIGLVFSSSVVSSEKPHIPELSDGIAQKVLDEIGGRAKGEVNIIYAVEIDGGYDVLVAVVNADEIRHFEVVAKGGDITKVIEVKPKFHGRSVKAKVIEEYKNVEDERAVAFVIQENGMEHNILTLEESGSQIGWYYFYTTITAKNIFGWSLAEVTAAGDFYIIVGYYVTNVSDRSSAWAQNWLGWFITYFYSDTYLDPDGIHGEVYAEAGFIMPIGFVNMWAWVAVNYNLVSQHDSGTF